MDFPGLEIELSIDSSLGAIQNLEAKFEGFNHWEKGFDDEDIWKFV